MAKKNDNAKLFTLVSLIDTRYIGIKEADFLNRYFREYSLVKRRYTAAMKDTPDLHKKRKESKALTDPKGILPYRVFRGVETSVKGLYDSQKTHLDNAIDLMDNKIDYQEGRLAIALKKLNNLDKTPDDKIHEQRLKNQMKPAKRHYFFVKLKRDKVVAKKARMVKKREKGDFSICLGGKKMVKARKKIHPNDVDAIHQWKRQWRFQRQDDLMAVGDADDKMGNSNMQVSMNEEGDFFFRITVPASMKASYDFKSVTLPLSLNYRQEDLIRHILSHQEGIGKKYAMSVRLKRRPDNKYGDFGKMEAHLMLHKPQPTIQTTSDNGVIGVDINADHLAVAETDQHGNCVARESHFFSNKGSTGQNNNILSLIIDKIINHAEETGKTVIIESLNFKQKKAQMITKATLEKDKKQNRMLSQLSYAKITAFFESKCFRFGIALKKVNPSYTSQIGQWKYQTQLNMSSHESAAYVIARRGQGFKEKVPNRLIKYTMALQTSETGETSSNIVVKIASLRNKTGSVPSFVEVCNVVKRGNIWKPLDTLTLEEAYASPSQGTRLLQITIAKLRSLSFDSEGYLPC